MRVGSHVVATVALSSLLGAARAGAQVPQGSAASAPALAATAAWATERFVRADAPLELTLSRPLHAGTERLALVVGSTDLAGLATEEGTRVVVRPRGVRLPAGTHEMIVYLVDRDAWTEVGRAPLRVLAWGGFEAATVAPGLTLNNAGQLVERTSAAESPSPRRTFQDFTGSAALQGALRRSGIALQTQWNVVGMSVREQALRFQQRQGAAPLVDLADFSTSLERRTAKLAFGTLSVGQQRHLLQSFATRGVSAALSRGPAALTLLAANGSSVVGWDNLTGLADGGHQVRAALIGVELLPRHPGALHLEATLLDGSVRPITGFTRGAIVDAERSDGRGVVLSAQSAGQRVRLRTEWADSRFASARDDQLTGDTAVVPLVGARRAARWAELAVDVLRQRRLSPRLAMDLSATLRHERVEPLFRSVTASPQADREENAGELSLALGGVALRVAHGRTGDNLALVPSVLRTELTNTAANVAIPLPQMWASRSWLPALTTSLTRTHARADGTPTNGDFRPVDLPDQMSVVADVGAQWTHARLRAGYRFNRSLQDNRQSGRERADFVTAVHAITLGVPARAGLELGLEATDEEQVQREQDQRRRLRRLGGNLTWQATRLTQLAGGYTATVSRDGGAGLRGTQGDVRAELSQAFGTGGAAGARGRAFVRFQRLSAETRQLLDVVDPLLTAGRRLRWSIATGLSYRVL